MTGRRWTAMALAVGMVLTLSGCGGRSGLPYAREMGDMALMRTMAVDTGGAVPYAVTISSGRRARGLQREAQPPLILAAGGDSLSGACLQIQGLSDSYVFYGYVDQLLLGETLTQRGVEDVLDYFARDVELGLGTQVWAVRGSAADAVATGSETGVEARLDTLNTDSQMGSAGITRTVGEVLSQLLEEGGAFLPTLSVAGEGEGALVETGYAVLRGDVLAGFLEGEQARGLELLAGRPGADVFRGTVGTDWAVLRLGGARTAIRLLSEEGQVTGLQVDCTLTADLAESSRSFTDDELQALCRQLEDRSRQRMEGTLTALMQWQSDCLALGRRAGMSAPALWAQVEEQWQTLFPRLGTQVDVKAHVRRI